MRLKIFWVAFLVTVLVLFWWKSDQTKKTILAPKVLVAASVVKVIDGDTVQVSAKGETEIVRLIGMDAPESVDPRKPVQCFGREASDKAKEILTNKKVFLEVDPVEGDMDIYNRFLRYVFLEDGTNFSKVMIADGFAREYTYYGKKYKYQTEFKQAQIEAKMENKGLWGVCK